MNDAPEHNLPDWTECSLRVDNAKYMKDNGLNDEGDSLLPNPIHEFIYEYDDADPYRSAWFMHRLEKLIEFVKSQSIATPE
jgi:hypothetical protein